MGACFSRLETEDHYYPTAKVVSAAGDLHEYPVPVTVSQVLLSERDLPITSPHPEPSPSPSPSPSTGYFVCNSDGLYYEERIPALPHGEELVGNQIYFVLPESKLDSRLSAVEMAALAVKASLALSKAEEKGGGGGRRRRRARARKSSIRISPVVEVCEGVSYNDGVIMNGGYYGNESNRNGRGSGDGGSAGGLRSGSFRKVQRVVSWKGAKAAGVRPRRTRLSTIHEGIVM